MKKADSIVLLAICWTLIVILCVTADSEVNDIPKKTLDPKGTSTLNSQVVSTVKAEVVGLTADSKKADLVKNGKDQGSELEKGVENNNNNNNKLKDDSGNQIQISSGKDNIQRTDKDNGDKKRKPEKGSESNETTKEKEASTLPLKKEGFHIEECDMSNSCKDEKVGLVACLRVPGSDSPKLSLLVQNKGKGPLSVAISAPDSVQLEKSQVQLKENEDKEVKVSITKAGKQTLIVLTAGKGTCTLNFQGLLPLNHNKDTILSTKSTSVNNMKKIPLIAFIVLGALVIAASAWMCISYQKRYLVSKNSKYQKLDTDLPVSGGANMEFSSNDGWDDSWGDDWDDEEAPKTPLLPLTPSLSAKGLASRKLNKEAWKD